MDHRASQLGDSLQRVLDVLHDKIRQREGVTGSSPARMEAELRSTATSLPALAFALGARFKLHLEEALPEPPGALRNIGWELNKRQGRSIHVLTIA
jgi:hypothetical protein